MDPNIRTGIEFYDDFQRVCELRNVKAKLNDNLLWYDVIDILQERMEGGFANDLVTSLDTIDRIQQYEDMEQFKKNHSPFLSIV